MTQPPRSKCIRIAALPSAAGRARAYTRWVLGAWRMETVADTVELLVSELVTNAVRATGVLDESADKGHRVDRINPIYLCISTTAEMLCIEVWDVSEVPPLKRVSSDEDETGRGLMLVQALSKEWGCEVLETGGKVVWCKCLIGEG